MNYITHNGKDVPNMTSHQYLESNPTIVANGIHPSTLTRPV